MACLYHRPEGRCLTHETGKIAEEPKPTTEEEKKTSIKTRFVNRFNLGKGKYYIEVHNLNIQPEFLKFNTSISVNGGAK